MSTSLPILLPRYVIPVLVISALPALLSVNTLYCAIASDPPAISAYVVSSQLLMVKSAATKSDAEAWPDGESM